MKARFFFSFFRWRVASFSLRTPEIPIASDNTYYVRKALHWIPGLHMAALGCTWGLFGG
jgi:hypothetical protein